MDRFVWTAKFFIFFFKYQLLSFWTVSCLKGGGAVAQSVERATPGEEVPDSIPAAAARSLLVGSMSV